MSDVDPRQDADGWTAYAHLTDQGATAVFEHILLPTDGSALAWSAIKAGIAFASTIDARVTGYHALPAESRLSGGDEIDREALLRYARAMRHEAELALTVIANEARQRNVRCAIAMTEARSPHDGIVAAADRYGCDLIFMASHGRTGLPASILGSVTQKVVTLAHVPVLVIKSV